MGVWVLKTFSPFGVSGRDCCRTSLCGVPKDKGQQHIRPTGNGNWPGSFFRAGIVVVPRCVTRHKIRYNNTYDRPVTGIGRGLCSSFILFPVQRNGHIQLLIELSPLVELRTPFPFFTKILKDKDERAAFHGLDNIGLAFQPPGAPSRTLRLFLWKIMVCELLRYRARRLAPRRTTPSLCIPLVLKYATQEIQG